MSKNQSEAKLQYALYALIAIGVIAIGFLLFNSLGAGGAQPTPVPTVKPNLELTIIDVPGCAKCFNVTEFEGVIKNAGDVAITKTTTIDYQQASELIAKYNITKVPTLLISGQTGEVAQLAEAWEQIGIQAQDGTLVLTKVPPLYFDLTENRFVGLVKATRIVDDDCILCSDVFETIAQIENAGIKLTQETEANYSSAEGKALIKQYNITKIPTVVLTGELSAYPNYGPAWDAVGTRESDGAFVWTAVIPPYVEMPSNKTRGFVTLTALVDPSCAACYDVRVHEQVFRQFGVSFQKISYVQSNSTQGKQLISLYNISFVPTVIIDSEVEEYYPYTQLGSVWSQVATLESDGNTVFRHPELLSGNTTYRNLTTGEIVSNATAG